MIEDQATSGDRPPAGGEPPVEPNQAAMNGEEREPTEAAPAEPGAKADLPAPENHEAEHEIETAPPSRRPAAEGPVERERRPAERTWERGQRGRGGDRYWEGGPRGRGFQERPGWREGPPERPPYRERPSYPERRPAPDFSHLDQSGRARMVDVGAKPDTERTATARCTVLMQRETLRLIESGGLSKGDVLAVAQVAGVMGAKRTPDLIPLCHPLLLNGVDLYFNLDFRENSLEISATVRVSGKTGVEMEALTAVSVAALTVYDMCKAVDREMVIDQVRLVHKDGGRSGEFRRHEEDGPPRGAGRREDRPDERYPRAGPADQRRRFDDQRQGFQRPARRPWRPDDS